MCDQKLDFIWPDLTLPYFNSCDRHAVLLPVCSLLYFFEFRKSRLFKTPMTVVVNTVKPAKSEHIIAVMYFFWSFLLLPKRFLGKRRLQNAVISTTCIVFNARHHSGRSNCSFLLEYHRCVSKKEGKAGSYYCRDPCVCCQLYCGGFRLPGKNPQQENKQVIEREIIFMKNTVKANQTQKGEQNKTKQHCCITFLFCCSVSARYKQVIEKW